MSRQSRQLTAQRLEETIAHLWTRYKADRENVEVRNRLAEHYTPLVQALAQRTMRHLQIRDVDSAMGDALLLLVLRIIPHYDGARSFRGWARHCIRQKLVERQRLEAEECKRFRRNHGDESDWPEIEAMYVRPKEPGADVRFAELTAALPARSAVLMWLRFYRHLSHRQIAALFDVNSRGIGKQIRQAIGVLQELAGQPPDDDDVEYEDDDDTEGSGEPEDSPPEAPLPATSLPAAPLPFAPSAKPSAAH